MPLTALFTRNRCLRRRLEAAVDDPCGLVATPSWEGFGRLIRERPVSRGVLDATAFPADRAPVDVVSDFRLRFPNVGLVLLSDRSDDPVRLFHLGKAAIRNLVLLSVDHVERELWRALAMASGQGATSMVLRATSPFIGGFELDALRIAMEGVHHRWSAEDFADEVGLSRAFLSVRLKESGLPSAGHLLIWSRLFHAAYWLEEPGRTGESVSRQLEYSSGAAFRRSLKHYTRATPTDIVQGGGLALVLERFADECGFERTGTRFHAA